MILKQLDEALEMTIEPTMMFPEDVPWPEDETLMILYSDAVHDLRVAFDDLPTGWGVLER